MKNFLYVAIAILIVLAAGYFVFFRSTPTPPENQTIQNPPPPSGNTTAIATANYPKGDTLVLGTSQGGVTVRNFYKDVVGTEGTLILFKDAAQFTLSYDPETSEFFIYVVTAPFDANRLKAEKEFLTLLNITENEACKLKVSATGARGVDAKEYGLSFCLNTLQ